MHGSLTTTDQLVPHLMLAADEPALR